MTLQKECILSLFPETGQHVSKEIEFIYGKWDDSYPVYMLPENGLYVGADSARFMLPTHITFVASSSFDGANFSGAVDSELILDDIKMVYE